MTLVGSKPTQAVGLANFPKCDEEVKKAADALWGLENAGSGEHPIGKGRVIWGRSLDQVVKADGLPPDVEFRQPSPKSRFDWIHRRTGPTDIYFLANLASVPAMAEVVFRAAGRQPELWGVVSGKIRDLPQWRVENGRSVIPLKFAPRQSWFVVFRRPAEARRSPTAANFPVLKTLTELHGPWQVAFDPKWGGPKQVNFEKLDDWITRPESGIRYYSGKAVYHNQFSLPKVALAQRTFLDLGVVKNVAHVTLNGRDVGVVWTAPWHVEITGAVRPGVNDLEIEVVNLWPNRLIGDATLPQEKRFTLTNVRTYDTMTSGTWGCKICEERKKSGQPAKLLSSGLLGPVTVQVLE